MIVAGNPGVPTPVYRVMSASLSLAAVLVTLGLLGAACGGGSQVPTSTPSESPVSGAFPQESDWQDCVLQGGGPAPGFSIEGRCASQSVPEGDALRVTEVQEWRCADFSGIGSGYEPCDGEYGRYTVVSLVRDGVSEPVSASGQLPPTAVQ